MVIFQCRRHLAVGRVLDGLFIRQGVSAKPWRACHSCRREIKKLMRTGRFSFLDARLSVLRVCVGLFLCLARYLDLVHRPLPTGYCRTACIHMEELITVLMGLLGLAACTFEKISGRARGDCGVLTRKKICLPAHVNLSWGHKNQARKMQMSTVDENELTEFREQSRGMVWRKYTARGGLHVAAYLYGGRYG